MTTFSNSSRIYTLESERVEYSEFAQQTTSKPSNYRPDVVTAANNTAVLCMFSFGTMPALECLIIGVSSDIAHAKLLF